MTEFLDFLVKNWQYISVVLVVVLEVILIIIKKRPKKYDEFVEAIGQVIASVPFWVVETEELCSQESSVDKKSWCIIQLVTELENRLKRDLTTSEEQYAFNTFSHFIEKVLTAPTKKGGLGREDE